MSDAYLDSVKQLLRVSLGAAVPLWWIPLDQIDVREFMSEAPVLAQYIAEHGDDLMFKSQTKGATADAFNKLARAIAICAYAPGGITFLGDHYERQHP